MAALSHSFQAIALALLNPHPAYRRLVAFAHDMTALAVCWYGAYWLRFNLDLPAEYLRGASLTLAPLAALHAPVYWSMGLYRGIWRYASLMDLRRIIFAVGSAAMLMS